MKKMVLIAGIITALVIGTGCGDEAPSPSVKDVGVEEIQIEEIRVEEIKVEEIRTECILIDDSFAEELEYNSQVNTWDGPNVTRWD